MRLIKQLSFIGLALMLVLSSCTTQKPFHTYGYRTDLKFGNRDNAQPDATLEKSEEKEDKGEILIAEGADSNIGTVEKLPQVSKNVDNKKITVPLKNKIKILSRLKLTPHNDKIKIGRLAKSQLRKEIKSTDKDKDEHTDMSAFAVIGFICSVLAPFLIFVTSASVVLFLFGIVFSSIGLAETSKGKSGRGFAIAGFIVSIVTLLLALSVIYLFLRAIGE